jgi:hypothetical protein
MRQISTSGKVWSVIFLILQFFFSGVAISQQTNISDYVIFGGTNSVLPGQQSCNTPGYGVIFGASSNIQGGSIGSYKLIQSTGTASVTSNIFSGGTVVLANSNTVSGRITAANLSALKTGTTILSVGAGASLTGNIDVNGDIVISDGTVSGIVTNPTGSIYKLGKNSISNTKGNPNLPGLPAMPPITAFKPYPYPMLPDITSGTITPGAYDDIKLPGNKTLTLKGTGIYVFDKIDNKGTNSFVFDFNGDLSGTFKIYVHNDVNLDKISVTMMNGGSANRIYTEVHGAGSGSPKYAFNIANGSSAAAATKWLGTVWVPYAAINIGAGTGNSSITGALWSGTQVNIQSGATIIYAPYSECVPLTANAGPDQITAATCGFTSIKLSGNKPSIGAGAWSIISGNGGSFSNSLDSNSTFTGTAGTTYTLRWTVSSGSCPAASDEVTIKFNQTPSKADAGLDQIDNSTCGLTVVTLSAATPVIGIGSWSIINGTGGSFGDASNPKSTFTGIAGASYTLRWTIINGICPASFDDVQIKFNQNPSTADAGSDQIDNSTCGLTVVTLAAATPVIGTGIWSVITGTGGSFGDASNPKSTFTGITGATYTLRWTVSNGLCPASSDDVQIKFNQNPIKVNAGADKVLEFTGLTKLKGTTATVGSLEYSWSATDGGVISSSTNTDEITVSSAGTFTFTVKDLPSGCATSDNVKVTSKLDNIIGSELQSIFENKTTDNTFFDIKDGYIKIDIIAIKDKRNDVLTTLLETAAAPDFKGLKDTVPNGFSGLTITGRFPIDSIRKLDQLSNIINYCRPYYRAILFNQANATVDGDPSNVGLLITAGDTAMKTHLVRSGYGIYGSGVKLGVISDSYSSIGSGTTATVPLQPVKVSPYILSPSTQDTIGTVNPIPQTFNTNTAAIDIANGDLPATIHELPAFPVSGTDEGRAMLQIVHDVAPAAELYFRTGFNTAGDFAKGIKDLKDAGCNIIVDDITYPTEPFLRDGIVARTVNEVKAAGVTYFSSAGNFGNKSYEKDFTPFNFNGKVAHDFGGGDVFQKIKLAPGDYTFVFQWVDNIYSLSETVGTVNDLDIYLTKNEDGTGLVGFNRNNLVGDPIEFIPITVPAGDSVEYNVFIVNNTPNNNTPNLRMKYVVFRGNPRFMEFNEGTSTIVGQANAEGAIAVGAARFNHVPGHPLLPNKLKGITKPQVESFSSVGGTSINGVPRQKPDLIGPDGGNTTVKMGQDYPDWALDGYSNFFGTSAAAPHVAAAAALIMEGRKKYLGATSTSPDEIKALFQSTAVDMETPGFDYISGSGLVDADAAMRTFAAPRPFSIKLVVPKNPIVIPGEKQFLLTVTGENFSSNSYILYGGKQLVTVYISPTKDTIQAYIPTFTDNPEITVFTPPVTGNNDGGMSNSLFFFDADIVVRAINASIKYGQQIPVLDTIITINGKLLKDTTVTLADLGLSNLKLTTTAGQNSNVGTYKISAGFDPGFPPGDDLLIKYNYQFFDAQLTIAKMPVKVTPNDKSIVYGQHLGNVTFKYDFAFPPANTASLTDTLKLYHEAILPVNALAVIKGGNTLNVADLANMNMMVTYKALNNSRRFKLENNQLQPITDLNTLNVQYLVDVAAQSFTDYKLNPGTASFYTAFPGYGKKGLLGANALTENTATVQIPNGGGLAAIINGMISEIINTPTGPVVPIVNNNLVQVLNGQLVQQVGADWIPVTNSEPVQLIFNKLARIINGVPEYLAEGETVQFFNGTLVQVNGASKGGLAQIVNGKGGLAQIVNSNDIVVLNGGGLAQIVNGVPELLTDGTLVMFPNGGGGLAQIVNGGGGLAQIVNGKGGLAQIVNGKGGLAQIVNGKGGLAQIVNGKGGLAQIVNGDILGAGAGTNNNTAVIIDESNVNDAETGNWLGALFGINMITGLDVGDQKLVPGILVNPNFDISYDLGTVHIAQAPLTVTAISDAKDYDGSISSSKIPVLTGLSPLDAVATAPTQTFEDKNAGQKAIAATAVVINDGNGGNNYSISYVPATGVIRKISAIITAQTDTKNYDGTNSSAVKPIVSGLILPDAVSFLPNQTFDNKSVGTSKLLTASDGLLIDDGNNGDNYNIVKAANSTGEIKKVTLTVKADDKTKSFGDSNPPLTVTYTGFVPGENLLNSGITGTPLLTTTAAQCSPIGTYNIVVSNGQLSSANYNFNFVNGVLTIAANPCLITHTPATSFSSSANANTPTSLWLSLTTKVAGQLSLNGDYLIFKAGSVTLNNISSTPIAKDLSIPDGKIIADNTVSVPVTNYDATTNTWITKVPPGFSSTSDIFITGAIINSSNGFIKKSSANYVVKGILNSNKYFKNQWAFASATYQLPKPGYYLTYQLIANAGKVVSVTGTYRAGTPIPAIAYLVTGGSGSGGSNCTGSASSNDDFTACVPSSTTPLSRNVITTPATIQKLIPDEPTTEGAIELYPNPATNSLTVSFVPAITGNSKIALLTIDGKKILEINNGIAKSGKKYYKKIDVTKLVSGVYLVQLTNNNKLTIKKIIITR